MSIFEMPSSQPVLTKLVDHKTFLKWRLNRDQTNITFDVY